MKRVTLFSTLTATNEKTVLDQILPPELPEKAMAFMPSEGIEGAQEYIKQWEDIAKNHNATFSVINNEVRSVEEQDKLLSSNILVISGGNTFSLLNKLRESGLDKSIKQFVNKPDFVLSGFSAGALVLTPSIKICNLPDFDENLIGLKNLDALGIVNFEIYPHYNKYLHERLLREYRKVTTTPVQKITDEEYVSIDL